MRRVKLSVATSLDNYIARTDGAVDWLFDDGEDYGMTEFFACIDAVLLGRHTHDWMIKHGMPFYPGIKNFVFTHQTGRDTYGGKVEYVSGHAAEFVRELKQQEGKAIWLCGGAELADELIRAKLVDEVIVAIHPRLLGRGIRLFGTVLPETELKLLEHKAWPSGLVSLTYEVVR
jgi:dihydrofolate reductase